LNHRKTHNLPVRKSWGFFLCRNVIVPFLFSPSDTIALLLEEESALMSSAFRHPEAFCPGLPPALADPRLPFFKVAEQSDLGFSPIGSSHSISLNRIVFYPSSRSSPLKPAHSGLPHSPWGPCGPLFLFPSVIYSPPPAVKSPFSF